ncbi:MAG TPA: efflux RND transporter periplasmic adaptor subunit [Gammaproteobacteria bacterium]|nr:efflux RND transporter periplasmic adaptor subunit [Gammaproteobacteria bacterium]
MDKGELDSLRIDREATARPANRRRWPWLLVAAFVAAAGAGIGGWQMLRAAPVAVQTVTVESSAPESMGTGGASVLNASGYVVALLASTVSSQITGQITEVVAEEGEHVRKGEILARLDDQAQKATVAKAANQLDTDHANVAKAGAQLERDVLNLRRVQAMAAQHLTSTSDLDDAQSQVAIDKASLAAAQGQLKVDRDALDSAKIQLGYTVIRAPFAGVVTEKYAHPGEMISPAAVGGYTKTGICRLVDMHSLEIDVDVNESYIHRVKKGMRVEAALDAYPNWRIPAHVISIVPTANRQKATVKVRIAFDKLDPRILPDMGVQVWFYDAPRAKPSSTVATAAPTTAQSFSVPRSAIRGSGSSSYVFTVVDAHAHKQTVKTGAISGGKVTVLGGVSAGDVVITHADKPLANGMPVRLKQSG